MLHDKPQKYNPINLSCLHSFWELGMKEGKIAIEGTDETPSPTNIVCVEIKLWL